MMRSLAIAALSLCGLLPSTVQSPVPVVNEPRHHLKFENEYVRVFDVVVGINLLREGIDLPEVTLVAILDADKEGFLRSAWSLVQMIGRAARNIGGEVVMYADTMTDSMKAAIGETDRRRAVQARYNADHGIVPATIVKGIRDLNDQLRTVAEGTIVYASERELRNERLAELDTKKVEQLIARMEAEMRAAAKELEFERAAALRDEIQQIRLRVLDQDQSAIIARAAELAAQRTPTRHGPRGGSAGGSRGTRGDEAPQPDVGERTQDVGEHLDVRHGSSLT